MYAYNPRKIPYDQLKESLIGNDRWDILTSILTELKLRDGESPNSTGC